MGFIRELSEKFTLYFRYRILPHTAIINRFFLKKGYNLVGYFDAPIGIAEVGRQCFLDMKTLPDLSCCILNYDSGLHEKLGYCEQAPYKASVSDKYLHNKNIFFTNADGIAYFIEKNVPKNKGYYNIGVFWWELEDYFYFDKGVNVVNEIYVFSDFIKKSILKSYPNKKVTKFSFPYTIPNYELAPVQTVRDRYGVRSDDFLFFFNFDFHSVYERKNPEGLLRAFSMAFKDNKKVKLLFKTIHSGVDNENYIKLSSLINELTLNDQVVFEDGNLEKVEFMNLLNSSDSYVSLHRSEGLGIGMMEAMFMKKPVIATAYGGNMEFTTTDTALLVDYKIVEIEKDNDPYKKGYKWAEPNIEDAAAKMFLIFNSSETRDRLAEKGYDFVIRNHTKGVFAAKLKSLK